MHEAGLFLQTLRQNDKPFTLSSQNVIELPHVHREARANLFPADPLAEAISRNL